jgi:hypothetical protein
MIAKGHLCLPGLHLPLRRRHRFRTWLALSSEHATFRPSYHGASLDVVCDALIVIFQSCEVDLIGDGDPEERMVLAGSEFLLC